MAKTKVLVLDPIHADGIAMLADRDDIALTHLPEPSDPTILQHMGETEALLLRGRHLPRETFEAATHLRLVSRHGVGCDNLDLAFLRARGISVAISADANWLSVAEHTLALMFAAAKALHAGDRAVREGNWAVRDALGTREIAGSNVLVIGFGRIGRAVAERCAALGAKVSIHDPAFAETPPFAAAPSLPGAVAAADFITLHAPRMPETLGMIDANLLACLRPGAILVNTARGGLVDEAAVLHALDHGSLARYATDVLAEEPPKADDPLLGRADVILTPHSAAMTAEAARRMATGAAQNILDFLDGQLAPEMTVV
ncbi:MAG: NAD(P)-dependent oxidoreductase [Pseudomonadota bacterium]